MLRGVEMTENLKMYHSDSGKFKGLVFDHSEKKIMGNFSTPIEIVVPQENVLSEDIFPADAYESIEGTLIRVYYFLGEWRISTNGKLDAFQSFWAEKNSFGELFEKCIVDISGTPLDVFLQSLDTSLKYLFILPTTGLNRIGTLPSTERPNLFLVGVESMDGTLLRGNELESIKLERNLWSFCRKFRLENMEQLLNTVVVDKINLIIYKNEEIFKYISQEYKCRCDLRNNEMDVGLRYIQLLKNAPENCSDFRKMYPEINFSTQYEEPLRLIAKFIHTSYMKRYIKKEYVHIPKIYFLIMTQCHQQYTSSRQKTTLSSVRETILNKDPKFILSLIRNFPTNE